jgi:gamma-glutamyltranspeptidase / glutathione hydrolase
VLSAGYSLILASASTPTPQAIAQSDPDHWSKEELSRYLTLQNGYDPEAGKRVEPQRSAASSRAMIAGTSEPLAVHAGFEVLTHGGNAADAALTTALAQVALTDGAAISYAGILTAVYYDAASGKVYTLNAAYNTVQNEKDPLSIPGVGEHSGRTALVPGFMAGVQALHDRFGKLPFSTLFGPAIWIAENGVVVNPFVGTWIRSQKNFITRLPETKRIFTKPDGELYKAGDLFRQPELAATLREVANRGSAYMYKGEWARHFVKLVQHEGGKMTLADLAAYRPLWTEPLQASYGDYQVVSLGLPNIGGFMTLGGLELAEVADLKKYGHYANSADALYYLIKIERITQSFALMPVDARQKNFPGVEPSITSLLSPEAAEHFWALIQSKRVTPPAEKPGSDHSAGIVAVDEQGNVAVILHSLNGILWGATGIFVDGISIPDSAAFQQRAVAEAGPGVRLPDPSDPVLVLKEGKPVLASVAIGSALHDVTLENLINILDFGMDPQTAVNQPNTQGPFIGMVPNAPAKPEYEKEAIGEFDFSPSVLDGVEARGQPREDP